MLTCNLCGSFRELVVNCADSLKNLVKVNISESNKNTLARGVLFTCFDITERNCAVLGTKTSTCSTGSTDTWINEPIEHLDGIDRFKIEYVQGEVQKR